jgi:hypothetical protein
MSSQEAIFWEHFCIVVAVVSGAALVVGLIGEYPESTSWKNSRLYIFAKLLVIVGVAGELVGDAGIFITSDRIQELTNGAITGNINVQQAMLNQLKPRGQFTRDEYKLLLSLLATHADALNGITIYIIPDPEAYEFGMTLLTTMTEAKIKYAWSVLKSNNPEIQGISSIGVSLIDHSQDHKACDALMDIVLKLIDQFHSSILCHFPNEPTPVPIPSLFIMLKPPAFQTFPEYALPEGTKLPPPAWERR